MDGEGKWSFWFYLCASVVKVLFGKLLWWSFGGLYVERFFEFLKRKNCFVKFFFVSGNVSTQFITLSEQFFNKCPTIPPGHSICQPYRIPPFEIDPAYNEFAPTNREQIQLRSTCCSNRPSSKLLEQPPQKMHRFVMFQRLIWFNFISIDSAKRSLVVVAPPRGALEIWPQLVVVVVVPQTKPKNGLRV